MRFSKIALSVAAIGFAVLTFSPGPAAVGSPSNGLPPVAHAGEPAPVPPPAPDGMPYN